MAKSYALAVGHLADRLKGYGPFVHPWPTDETHLSLEQRTEFQQLLIARGIMDGEPDGVIGPATLEAVRTYQRAKGLGGGRLSEPDPAQDAAQRGPAAADRRGAAGPAGRRRRANPPAAGQPAAGQPAPAGAGQPAAVGQE